MAKKKKKVAKLSKSQLIRNYMEENPEEGPKAVAVALSKPGYKITAAFVSTIKSSDRRKSTFGLISLGRNGRTLNSTVSVEGLLLAKHLIEQVGGLKDAKAALEAYSRLVS